MPGCWLKSIEAAPLNFFSFQRWLCPIYTVGASMNTSRIDEVILAAAQPSNLSASGRWFRLAA